MKRLRWTVTWGALCLGALSTLAIAQASEDETYTLYRSSVVDVHFRIHVATFDAEGEENMEAYNRENCFLASDLFQHQPDVKVRFWCEKGRYRK